MFLDGYYYVNVRYYLICVKLFKNATKIGYSKLKRVSTSGGLPRQPTGAAPLDPAVGLPSPRLPRLCSSKMSL